MLMLILGKEFERRNNWVDNPGKCDGEYRRNGIDTASIRLYKDFIYAKESTVHCSS